MNIFLKEGPSKLIGAHPEIKPLFISKSGNEFSYTQPRSWGLGESGWSAVESLLMLVMDAADLQTHIFRVKGCLSRVLIARIHWLPDSQSLILILHKPLA